MPRRFKIRDIQKHLVPLSGPSQLEVRIMANLNQSKGSNQPKFLILDFRAVEEDGLDDALVLDTADTIEEARKAAKLQGGGAIYRNIGEMISFSDLVEIVEA